MRYRGEPRKKMKRREVYRQGRKLRYSRFGIKETIKEDKKHD